MNPQKEDPTGRYAVRRSRPLPHNRIGRFRDPTHPEHQIRGESVDTVHTKNHQKAPEQGKYVPEVGLEPGSSP